MPVTALFGHPKQFTTLFGGCLCLTLIRDSTCCVDMPYNDTSDGVPQRCISQISINDPCENTVVSMVHNLGCSCLPRQGVLRHLPSVQL